MNKLNVVVLNEYRISKVLHNNDKKEEVNLLAIFGFPSLESKTHFFSSEIYQAAKRLFAESTTNFKKLIE